MIGTPSHRQRRQRLRERMVDDDVEAALVTKLVNIRYLTGFTGSNAALLVCADGRELFCTDGRYGEQAANEVPDMERVISRDCAGVLVRRAGTEGVRRLAVEEHDVTVEQHRRLAETLREVAVPAELVRLGHAVERLREVKDEGELALLGEACAISDRAFADLLDSVLRGRTERQIALELERRMVDHGAEGVAFPTIVASGPNSAIPHHQPTERRVLDGDLLKIDFGARFGGYHADETRTLVIGRAPATWQVELYELVFAAQKAGRETLAPGVKCADIDAAARRVVEAAGYGDAEFSHPVGHGVGLEIHEDPLLGRGQPGTLAVRTPVTVEPGVYLRGRGGVRIEDTLVVRDAIDGGPELFTLTTKELLVL